MLEAIQEGLEKEIELAGLHIAVWEIMVVLAIAIMLFYASNRILQSTKALNWAKDRIAEMEKAKADGLVTSDMTACYEQAIAALDDYIKGLADGVLSFREAVGVAWHAYRAVREFWKLIA